MVVLQKADPKKDAWQLCAMEARVFPTADCFEVETWNEFENFFIMRADMKAGLAVFSPNLKPGSSFMADDLDPGAVWLVSILVLPELQRQGIGKEALRQAIEWAKSIGFSRFHSNFRVSNEASRRLHAACGFAEVGIRPEYYSDPVEDSQVVRLQL